MLPTPEKRGPVYYQPPMAYGVPIPADPQLIQEVVNLLTLYLKQLDWITIRSVVSALADLLALGEGAWAARRYLEELVRARKQQKPPPAA